MRASSRAYLFTLATAVLSNKLSLRSSIAKMRHQELVQVWWGPWGIIALRITEMTRNGDLDRNIRTVWEAERVALVSSPSWVLKKRNFTGNVGWNIFRVFIFKKMIKALIASLGYLTHCSSSFWVWLSIWIIRCSRKLVPSNILNASTILI